MIGWFLLAVLGERCGVAEASGVELPLFAFGVGALFLAIAYVSVFQAFSLPAAPTPPDTPPPPSPRAAKRGGGVEDACDAPPAGAWAAAAPREPRASFAVLRPQPLTQRGKPALFLLLAPPSVAGLFLLERGDGASASAVFGAMLFLLLLLVRSGPIFLSRRPAAFGEFWAYCFPLSALATLATNLYAARGGTRAAGVLAAALVCLATCTLGAVIARMSCFLRAFLTEPGVLLAAPLAAPSPLPPLPPLSPRAVVEAGAAEPLAPAEALPPESTARAV